MLSIRLSRVGKKKQPIYRVVVQDKQRDPWGKSVEIIGHYNPRANPKEIVFKEERVKYWLSVGAQPAGQRQADRGRQGTRHHQGHQAAETG